MSKIVTLILLVNLLAPLRCQALPGFMEERMGTMSGQLILEGNPLSNAVVAFFNVSKGLPPIAGQGGRAPDYRTFSDQEGKFSLRLPQSSYYIGILQRAVGAGLGPPKEGEAYYFAVGETGKLRRAAIENRQSIDYGAILCAVPGVFRESEETFTVTGTVVRGAGDDLPFQGAIVTAKGKTSQYRPEYISSPTGPDGKFSLQLPPDKPFTLLARTAITGNKPEPGDEIGKYGSNYLETQIANVSQFGPPPGIDVEKPVKVSAADPVSVSGESGQVISGLIIHMYKMPDQKAIQEENQKKSSIDYEEGAPLRNLLFTTNSAELAGDSTNELDLWVKFLTGKSGINIELVGYTDNVGTAQYNQQLSVRRAQSVGSYLIWKGLDPARIVAIGYGESNPVADNSSDEGRRKNRRVEIKFVK